MIIVDESDAVYELIDPYYQDGYRGKHRLHIVIPPFKFEAAKALININKKMKVKPEPGVVLVANARVVP